MYIHTLGILYTSLYTYLVVIVAALANLQPSHGALKVRRATTKHDNESRSVVRHLSGNGDVACGAKDIFVVKVQHKLLQILRRALFSRELDL